MPRVFALINDQSVSVGQPFLFGDFLCRIENVHVVTRVRKAGESRRFFARHDHDMSRSLRIDIAECDNVLVFIDDLRGNLAVDDLCEERSHDRVIPASPGIEVRNALDY